MKHIRTKLWLGMMVLIGIIILFLWLFQIVFLEKFYSTLELTEVMKNARTIVAEIEQLDDMESISKNSAITHAIDSFVYEKQMTVQIIDAASQPVYQMTSGDNTNTPKVMKEAVLEVTENALTGIETKKEVTHPKFGYQLMIISLPIYEVDSVKGAMILTFPMAQVEDTVFILKKQLIIITFILFIISALLSFVLSKSFTKPILNISKVAKSYSAGKFDERINKTGNDEIGQLANRMNRMGEKLARNEMLQKELIANVSHELRTPLTLIRGYAETLRDVTGAYPEKREKQLGVIIEESERLSYIVEDILNLSQLQAGAIHLQQEPFSLKDMLDAIEERFALQTEGRAFQINGLENVTDYLIGDSKKIEQVFYNLISNAIRHTKEEELVEVLIFPKTSLVRIEVRDHGEGIAKEDLQHIFERYYKGKRVGDKKENATGLGLAIVKSILEMHQISYGVESELGIGTTFWFELNKVSSQTSL